MTDFYNSGMFGRDIWAICGYKNETNLAYLCNLFSLTYSANLTTFTSWTYSANLYVLSNLTVLANFGGNKTMWTNT